MRFYYIGLGIWILMLLLAMVNTLGIFQHQFTSSQLNASKADVTITDLTNKAAVSQSKEDQAELTYGSGSIWNAISYFKTAFIDSIYIMGIARQYQIDDRISAPFQVMYTFILTFGLWQFITGRGTKIME